MKSFIEGLKKLDDDSKKKLKIFMFVAIGILVLIILIAILAAALSNRSKTYEQVEEIMAKAAYNYYQDNKEQLPNEEVKTTVVSVDTLVQKEYMKPLDELIKNDKCSGNVEVSYVSGNDYNYQAFLNCGNFKTKLLLDAIKENNKIVTSDAGLYDESGTLRFRGEYLNNYIKLGEIVYRIIKIDNENKIYVTPQELDYSGDNYYVYWDDRYNTQEDAYYGINDYNLSRIKASVEKIYEELNPAVKQNTVPFKACIGKRGFNDSNSTECNQTIDVSIGLISLNEYMRASLSPSCTTPANKECSNYNYLYNDKISWWMSTADSSDTTKAYFVNYKGEVDVDKGYVRKIARYVLALNPNTVIKSGDGSLKQPYELR